MSRHKHWKQHAEDALGRSQITFANVLDKLEAALPDFKVPPLDAASARKRFREYAQEPPSVPVDTSETAALEILPRAGTIRANVLAFIRHRGPRGATEREVEHALRLPGNTARPRLWELEGNVPAGRRPRPALIYKSDEKREGMRVYKSVSV